MAPAAESQYKDLLNPVKEEKSFGVNISELLQSFVSDLLEGRTAANFNAAGLILQGSASVYGKKVEYLYNLATQLHNSLVSQKKHEPQQAKKETKEKEKKEVKLSNLFLSVDFKMGKNLSCLRKKNVSKTAPKKSTKKIKSSGIPVHVLSNDTDDKGEVFYDTRGDVVGNKRDFAINRCRLISSGWFLLPNVNPSLVPSVTAIPDYYDDLDQNEIGSLSTDDIQKGDPVENDCMKDIQSTPDDGFGSYPPSSEIQESNPATDANSENMNSTESPIQSNSTEPPSTSTAPPSTSTAPPSTSTAPPSTITSSSSNDVEMYDSPAIMEGDENVPAEGEDGGSSKSAPPPVRQPRRPALQAIQLPIEDDPLAGIKIDKELLQRREIQKKNVRRLPNKLKLRPGDQANVLPITYYCSRTYFALDEKALSKSLLNFDVDCFDQHSGFLRRILEKLDVLKTAQYKNKTLEPIEDEREVDVEGIECMQQEANEDDESLCIPFDDNDIQIDHDIILPPMQPPPLAEPLAEGDNAEPVLEVPAVDANSPDLTQLGQDECDNYLREVHEFIQNSDITQRVHDWEKSVKPFLDELEHRENFDINLYGSRILNAFEDSNRKQTMTFRQFCKNKEKWEIHRYFMALLPLANIGNVSIESELKEDGTEEIFVTLLSRKMHHLDLENFGHTDNSHS